MCPDHPEGHKTPYPTAQIAEGPDKVPGGTLPCPGCGHLWPLTTRFSFESLRPPRPGSLLGPAAGRASLGYFESTLPRSRLTSPTSRLPTNPQQPSTQPAPAPAGAARGTRVAVQEARVTAVEPGDRRTEALGSEETDFDNSESSSTSVETLHITHSTEFVLLFDAENATMAGGGGSVGLLGFASLQGTLQETLRRHHSVSVTSTFTVERTSQISVPAHKHVRVTLSWKRIWQDGTVRLKAASGPEVSVPYSMTVDLSFDKKTVDLA